MDAPGQPSLPAHVVRFLTGVPRFAAVATVDPDGGPRQTLTWYRLGQDGSLWLNSRLGRRWPANLTRDGRAAIAVVDHADPTRWVGLSARLAEVVDDVERARADIIALARRYEPGGPDPADVAAWRSQPRVMFRLEITGVHDHLED